MSFFQRFRRVENPVKLNAFLESCKRLWKDEPLKATPEYFQTLCEALDALLLSEIEFYYRARRKQRAFSGITRWLAWSLGTAGFIAPLLTNLDPVRFKALTAIGYVLMAGATAVVLVNRLFGATGGHVRNVTAQLELEHLLTRFRLDWAAWRYRQTAEGVTEPEEAFKLLHQVLEAFYAVIKAETTEWGRYVSTSLEEYSTRIGGSPKSPAPGAKATPGGGAGTRERTEQP